MDTSSNSQLPRWFIKSCKWLWKKQEFIWGTVLLAIVLNSFATWLFTPFSIDYKKLPIWWIFQNALLLLFFGICLLLIICIIYIGSHSNFDAVTQEQEKQSVAVTREQEKQSDAIVQDQDDEIKQRYLRRLIRDNLTLTLKGIPAGLIDKGVQLDEVYIPLQFRPNRPLAEYPLTESERIYLQECLERDEFPKDLQRILIEAEKNWFHQSSRNDRIDVKELWKWITREQPSVVIQGFPGMGKSTFMSRLTLHMARRGLEQLDSTMIYSLEPPLIPIFLSLGQYASKKDEAKKSNRTFSLFDFLELILQQLNIPGLVSLIDKYLAKGKCLVLFDGLDEVSDPQMRKIVQEEIRYFILEKSDAPGITSTFNRFLITSRVAGYDQNAFPAYTHFTVAELTPEQITDFLPRWCRANVRRDLLSTFDDQSEQTEAIANEAELMVSKLNAAITHHQGVRELVENPLLLTLLAVMQQNSIELPKERVELYSVVTRTLLENRNIAKGLTAIPEAQAIQRLGPIAFQMQETKNSFARQSDVLTSLIQTIQNGEGGTADQVEQEAKNFLERIRVRAGLFVLRTGDFFGFFHRTFQEYFAARYMLNQIKVNTEQGIRELVSRARRSDDLWREPFLLAIGYQSNENDKIASQIIQNLLASSQETNSVSHIHDLLLAAESLIEAKPSTLGIVLEKQIAELLLESYAIAQKGRDFMTCQRIEGIILRWLLNVPKEAYRPALLIVLQNFITSREHLTFQCATITMLITIANQLNDCTQNIFDMLIPPLLALAGLPSVDKYVSTSLLSEPDLIVSDLALTALSFMGKRGPGGAFLANVRKYFSDDPNYLERLALCSLESGILLTPVNVPLTTKNYESYLASISDWVTLQKQYKQDFITDADIKVCISIHQSLLDCAEEVCYPSAEYLLNMLRASIRHSDQPWQEVWRQYLLEQMVSGNYACCQESSLLFVTLFGWHQLESLTDILWATLFPKWQVLIQIPFLYTKHHDSSDNLRYRFTQHFLATISTDLLAMRSDLLYSLNVRDMKHVMCLRYLRNMKYLDYLSNTNYLIGEYANYMNLKQRAIYVVEILGVKKLHVYNNNSNKLTNSISYLGLLRADIYHTNLSKLEYRKFTSLIKMRDLRYLRSQLLTSELSLDIIKHIPADEFAEYRGLLVILLGRIMKIQETGEKGEQIEYELQKVVRFVHIGLLSVNEEIHELTLDIIRYLPSRTENEIKFIIRLAEESDDVRVQYACVDALERSKPVGNTKLTLVLARQSSKVEKVRAAIAKLLDNTIFNE